MCRDHVQRRVVLFCVVTRYIISSILAVIYVNKQVSETNTSNITYHYIPGAPCTPLRSALSHEGAPHGRTCTSTGSTTHRLPSDARSPRDLAPVTVLETVQRRPWRPWAQLRAWLLFSRVRGVSELFVRSQQAEGCIRLPTCGW